MSSKNTGKHANGEMSPEQQIRTLKNVIIACLVIIIILCGIILLNKSALSDYKQIESGIYYTEDECKQMYLPQTFINVSLNVQNKNTIIPEAQIDRNI